MKDKGTRIDTIESHDWPMLIADLNKLLRLRTTSVGMKFLTNREEMEALVGIHHPKHVHTTDQIVARAAGNGWTVGITNDDLAGQASAAPRSACTHRTKNGNKADNTPGHGMAPPRMPGFINRLWMLHPMASTRRWRSVH